MLFACARLDNDTCYSEHDALTSRSEAERLRAANIRLEEAAQAAEINLMFKTNQLEQKLAVTEREVQKQQSHSKCEDTIAELKEKTDYLEGMLSMLNAEIEEKDDRYLE